MAKKSKYYVYRNTIWNNVGGGLSSPGATKLCKVGGHKVLLTLSQRLNKYGNPVHTASIIGTNGSVKATAR